MEQMSIFDNGGDNNISAKPNLKLDNFFDKLPVGKEITITGNFIGNSPIYSNKDNGYKVSNFKINTYIDAGSQEEYNVGIRAVVTGYYEFNTVMQCKINGKINIYNDQKQIAADGVEFVEPQTEDDIISFLGSGFLKGVKKKIAEKIVKGYKRGGKVITGFGLKTFEIIRNDYIQLTKISGITEEKAKIIHDSYLRNYQFQSITTFLKKFSDNETSMILTPQTIVKIYEKYQENTVDTIKNNPFVLTEIKGFGFKRVDLIARRMGLVPHNTNRVKSGLIYAIEDSTSDGNCYLTHEELIKKGKSFLDICLPLDQAKTILKTGMSDEITIKIDGLNYSIKKNVLSEKLSNVERQRVYRKNAKIIIDPINKSELDPIINTLVEENKLICIETKNKKHYYTPGIYDAEVTTAECIKKLLSIKAEPVKLLEVSKYIQEFEEIQGFTLEEKQKQFIKEYFQTKIIVLAGHAGTGKSTTVQALLYVIKKISGESVEVSMVAPTGKAAKRITEITGYEAKTIHRYLEFNSEGEFTYNKNNPVTSDVLICDETSMLDILLCRDMMVAIDPQKTTLVLIGDIKQLPSVGPGYVLGDIINSKKVPTVHLEVIKRQAESSGIVKNAHQLIEKEMIYSNNKDFFVINSEDAEKMATLMIKSIDKFMSNKYNYKIDDIQVVCPQKTTVIGTFEMNRRIQSLVNPEVPTKKEISRGRNENAITFRIGDKVIHLTNNYGKKHYIFNDNRILIEKTKNGETCTGVFNGEIGKIVDIIFKTDKDENSITELTVQYDGFIIMYKKEELSSIDLAYALTVHKLQGSQIDGVILFPVHFKNIKLLNSNLGYTGITRSQQIVCVFAQRKALEYMINNTLINKRNTMLDELIATV